MPQKLIARLSSLIFAASGNHRRSHRRRPTLTEGLESRCLLSAAPRVEVFEPVGGPDSFVKTEAHFRLVFSEPVVGLDVTDFRVLSNPPFGPTWTALGLTGSGAEWTVSVYGLEGTGPLQVYLPEDTFLQDTDGNSLYAGVSHGSFEEVFTNGVIRGFRSVLSEDFDGDGQAELVFRQPVSTALFANGLTRMDFSADGVPQFATIPTWTGGAGPLLAGDLTGDDRPELVITQGAGMEVLGMEPNGAYRRLHLSGTLFDESSYGPLIIHWDHPGTGHFADLTGDGAPDMTVVVQRNGSYHLAIVNGLNGNFFPQQFIPELSDPGVSSILQVTTGDLNTDGLSDLVMSVAVTDNFGQLTRESRVFLGTPDNTPVEPGQQVLQSVYPGRFGLTREFALDDMDGDGTLDWIAQQDFGGLHVFYGNGDGTFDAGTAVGMDGSEQLIVIPGEVVRSDVNADGRADIFALDITADDELQPVRRVRLFLQTVSGDFQLQSELLVPQLNYFVYGVPLQPLADGQHGLELVFSRDGGASGVSTFLQKIVVNDDLQLIAEPLISLDGVIQDAVHGDFDGDGVQDIAVITSGPVDDFVPTDLNLLLRNAPGTASEPFKQQLLIAEPAGNQPTSMIAADIDNDGFADALTVSPGSNEISFRHGFTDGLFGPRIDVGVGAGPVAATTGDFNRDGIPDVATANREAGSVSLVLGDPQQTLVWSSDIPLLGTPVAIEAVDLDGDKDLDLIVALSTSRSVAILRGTQTGTFSEPQYVFVDHIPTTMAVADLNSDGLPDIVTGSNSDSRLIVLLTTSGGIFQSIELAAGGPVIEVATTDMTKDGKTDIVTLGETLRGYTGITLYAGNNNGQFAAGDVISGSLFGATDLAVGDINGGGDDLLVLATNIFGISQVMYITEDLFSSETPYFMDVLATSASAVTLTAADFTSDGRVDIALADFHRDAVRVFRNMLNGAVSAYNVQVVTNLPPSLNPVSHVQFPEDTAEFRIPLTGITPGAGENQLVRVVTYGSTNWELIPNPLFVPGKDASTGELVLKPTRLRSGQSRLFFYLEDAGDDGNFQTTDDNGYSNTYSFIATVIPTRAVVLSPVGTVTSQQPEFYWTDVPGAVNYRVWIANASTGKNPLLLETTDFPGFVPSTPLGIGKIDVWIQAVLADGTRLPWSVQHRFDIQTPVEINPLATRQTNPRPTLTWPAVPGADAYEVFASNVSTGQSGVIRQTVTTNSWTPTTDLAISQWRFWVRAVIRGRFTARWSTALDVRVVTPPTPVGPSVFTTLQQPTFQWSRTEGSSKWGFQLRNLTTGQIVSDIRGLTTNSYTPPAPLSPGRYRWWAFAESATGFRGDWSVAVNVGISDRPILLAPSGNVSRQNLTFSWLPFPNAISYEIWITRMEPRQQVVFHLTNITNTSFQLTSPLTTGAVHRFWIRAVISDTQITQWSQSLAFTVAAAQTASAADEIPVNLLRPELLTVASVQEIPRQNPTAATVRQTATEIQPVAVTSKAITVTAAIPTRPATVALPRNPVPPASAPHPALLDDVILRAVTDLQQTV